MSDDDISTDEEITMEGTAAAPAGGASGFSIFTSKSLADHVRTRLPSVSCPRRLGLLHALPSPPACPPARR
jgi:hypothetical protein